jgi:D-lactate dehydrogenase (cytochrome)
MQKETLDSLKKVLAPRQIVTNPLELVTYEVDAALDRGTPDGAVFPATAEEVVRLVKWARAHRLPLVARGAGTGLSGGAVAEHGGLIVEFSRMNRILDFNEAGRSVVFEPGVVNQTLDELTKAKGLYYPPDPSSGRSATMGGNLAENAGGPHCFKYGVTTNYITGMEIITADGARLRLGGQALDYPEYDLAGLINGSEGTLALITQASARLIRNPPAIKTMMAAFDTVEAAGAAVSAVIARGLVPATLEMMDQKIMRVIEDFAHAGLPVNAGAGLIVEADGYAESVASQIEEIAAVLREHQAYDLRIAQNAEERNKIWYGRKSAVGAMSRLAPQFLLLDGSVPRSQLAATLSGINAICDAAGLRVGYVFHAGDGNLHPLILIEDPDNEADVKNVLAAGSKVMELCVNRGGSITGEHGVGIEKRAFMPLMYSADELQTMREVRQVFDPDNLLNPGKIFPADKTALPVAAPQPAVASGASAPLTLPTGLCAPQSAREAAQWVASAAAANRPLRLRGGGTKSGLLPAADTTLSTQALRGVEAFSLDDLYITVRAGTPLAEMQGELARHHMWVPLVSPWAASTVGGIVSTSFNAPLRMRYGAVRDLVLALTVVLPDGRLIHAGRPVVKNVAGYDMPKLFVGAHGTLGLITDVTLKLLPLPRAQASLVTPVDSLRQGARWGKCLLEKCLAASALILCQGSRIPGVTAPYALIHTVEGLPEDVAAEMEQARAALKAAGVAGFQEMELSGNEVWAGEIGAPSPTETRLRLGVAPQDLASVLDRLDSTLANTPLVADLASGFLYVRSDKAGVLEAVRHSAPNFHGYTVALSAPGRPSEIWRHNPDSKALMEALKARWNPRGLFNPDAFIV